MSYANLIWTVEIMLIIFFAYDLWSARKGSGSRPSSLSRSYQCLSNIWCVVVVMPYLLELAAVILPPDNFLFAYTPVMGTDLAIQLATCIALIRFIIEIFRHKSLVGKQKSINVVSRKFEDLAF